jgi:glucose/arabinose dehydrogenase
VIVAFALALDGCSPSGSALCTVGGSVTECGETTGIVTNVAGPSVTQVDSFTLRTAQGQSIQFAVGRLDLTDGGLNAPHIRVHLVSGAPITVQYKVDDGQYVALRYFDAPLPSASASANPPPASASLPATASPPTQAPSASPSTGPVTVVLEPFAQGFSALTFVANAGDGTGDLYAVEQAGQIWRIGPEGTVADQPFLDVSSEITAGGERGLLGLAFHPDYRSNRRFFVAYTDTSGADTIAEFTATADGSAADPGSERIVLKIDEPFANHNGGMLAFGPDGDLYFGTGDGGSGGDPMGNGQNTDVLLGKILRLDVDHGDPYAIPPGNPFAQGGGAPEIWDWGVRNPWRFSFDSQTGDLWIADVGQGTWEEIDAEPAGTGGRNYGWNVVEGNECYGAQTCDRSGLTPPVAVHDHSQGVCAIVGGYVYRGAQFPALDGRYLFSDNCAGTIWALGAAAAMANGSADYQPVAQSNVNPSAFGVDEAGELYLVDLEGDVFRITAE